MYALVGTYIYIIYIHVQNNERVVKVGRSIEKVCHKFRMCIRGVNGVEHDIATSPIISMSVTHIIYQFEVCFRLS